MTDLFKSLSEEQVFQLISLAQAGDENALSQLIIYSTPAVHAQAKRFVSSGVELADLCQEGMIGALCAIETYTRNSTASFNTYLNVCIKNRLLSVNRKHSEKSLFFDKTVSLSEDGVLLTATDNLEEQMIGNDEYNRIFEFIDSKLSNKEQQVLRYFLSGLSYEEIAKKNETSVKSVDGTLQRARKKLKTFKQ